MEVGVGGVGGVESVSGSALRNGPAELAGALIAGPQHPPRERGNWGVLPTDACGQRERERDDLYLDQRSAVPSSASSGDPPDPGFPIRTAPQSSVLLMSYQCKIECFGRCTVSVGGKVQRNADHGFGLM